MKRTKKNYISFRIIIAGIFFSLLYTIIGIKAIHLHIFKGAWLSDKAEGQYRKSIELYGKRGTIYDAKYREMAVSVDAVSIAAFPASINNPESAARSISKILRIDYRRLKKHLSSNKSFVWIKRDVFPDEKNAVAKLDINGIDFIPGSRRVYPNKTLAAQVLGFTGTDDKGLEGLEFFYNNYLKASKTIHTVMKDALGRGFDAKQKIIANGNNLVLTIDRTVQYIAEKTLEETAIRFSAKSGIVVIMTPQTGAILALAHYPRFNPNTFRKFGQHAWRNRAVTDPFEPGSTMKVFLAAAAIESGYCTADTIFFCENGSYRIDRNLVHDVHSYGWLSLQQIVKYSSNIGAVKVSETIGKKTLYESLKAFGFGEKTGINCPGETRGTLIPPYRWSKIDTGAISFGQGVSVSAIQLISALSAIANNGILMKPYLVKAVTDENGKLVKKFAPQRIAAAVSPKTAKKVKMMMKTVTSEDGTGVNAALEEYSVCGKTGTSQKIDAKGGYAKDRFIASFAGFVPAEKPEIAILVIIDEPEDQHYGSIVAAPAFKKIASETLNYMNIHPHKDIGSDDRERLTVSLDTGIKG
ncbi:MAG: penicillin-binding protein 2 [Deltaproteobacteria bacterium]|nr:penicillin-binding protein 2 [Deltaproteobacteria bacterium]MBW2217879.1 penicillin-binding protein 2 [Deltaproteobacteria bacterium]